jgi:glycosyltransferase involved in cell wall biosynthesis
VSSDPRLQWPGARSHGLTRQAIRRAHLLVLPSLMEGGANVVAEAITAGTPVLASRVSGNVGMLGRHYPGLFPVGDAQRLARLLRRCLEDPGFLPALQVACRARRHLFEPRREHAAVNALAQALVRSPAR